MGESEHEQLLKILNTYGCRHTENANGVFVNLAHVPAACVHQMQQLARFWKDQNQHIHQSEQARIELQQAIGGYRDRTAPLTDDDHSGTNNPPAAVAHRSKAASVVSNGCSRPEATDAPLPDNGTEPIASKPRRPRGATGKGGRRKQTKAASTAVTETKADASADDVTVVEPHAKLSPEEESLIRTSVGIKRRQLALNKGGKQLLRRGGATSRVARTCMASEENLHVDSHGAASVAGVRGFGAD